MAHIFFAIFVLDKILKAVELMSACCPLVHLFESLRKRVELITKKDWTSPNSALVVVATYQMRIQTRRKCLFKSVDKLFDFCVYRLLTTAFNY